MRYSVIIPCYKSDQTIEHVVDMTRDEMIHLGKGDVEFVLVNDCSPDGGKTIRKLREMAQKHADVKVIGLAKNSGQHNALMAALRHAEGDIIIGMDDDGQTHPSQLSKLLGALDEGYDLVYGYYPEKKHNWFRNLGSRFNDLTVNMMIKKPKEVRTSSYFVVRKFVRDYTIQYEGSYTYLLGLFMRCTQNIASVPVQHFERESGESGYTLGQLIRLWSSIIGFSVIPLRCRCRTFDGTFCADSQMHRPQYVDWLAFSDVCDFFFLRSEFYVFGDDWRISRKNVLRDEQRTTICYQRDL